MQERLREVDARLAQSSGELELARGARAALEQRLMGAKTRAEVDEMVRRLEVAEAGASQKFNDHANLSYRAEVCVVCVLCARVRVASFVCECVGDGNWSRHTHTRTRMHSCAGGRA